MKHIQIRMQITFNNITNKIYQIHIQYVFPIKNESALFAEL